MKFDWNIPMLFRIRNVMTALCNEGRLKLKQIPFSQLPYTLSKKTDNSFNQLQETRASGKSGSRF